LSDLTGEVFTISVTTPSPGGSEGGSTPILPSFAALKPGGPDADSAQFASSARVTLVSTTGDQAGLAGSKTTLSEARPSANSTPVGDADVLMLWQQFDPEGFWEYMEKASREGKAKPPKTKPVTPPGVNGATPAPATTPDTPAQPAVTPPAQGNGSSGAALDVAEPLYAVALPGDQDEEPPFTPTESWIGLGPLAAVFVGLASPERAATARRRRVPLRFTRLG
jgi:hypothetical protein